MKTTAFSALVAGIVSVGMAALAHAAEPLRPNIILIMCDDMGWSDIGCYGGQVATPTLDKMAAEGARFTQFYNKANSHEGGIRTPMIARWPGKIKANSIERQPGHIIDFMATFIDMAGTEYPGTYKGKDIIPLEGKSLLPVFLGEQRTPHKSLIWHWAGNRAIRADNFKAVWEKRERQWKLYDLAHDQTETKDLAAVHPELTQMLATRWYEWADMTEVKYSDD